MTRPLWLMTAGSSEHPGAGAPVWLGQGNAYWTISPAAVAAAPASAAASSTNLLGSLLPAISCYFDITLGTGYESSPTRVGFIGVASGRTPGNAYAYTDAGASLWYWNGSAFLDGSNVSGMPANLESGTYRIAIDLAGNLMYAKRLSGPGGATSVGSVALPSGYSAGALRPTVLAQSSFYAPSATLVGLGLGAGGLY